jgi:hypothetical protein
MRSVRPVVAMMICGPTLFFCTHFVGQIEGRGDLPPCVREHSRTQDCHITDPAMAIDMMTRRPDRELQPNAYAEFRQYERQREKEMFESP